MKPGKSRKTLPYEMYKTRKPLSPLFSQEWKVTARYEVHTTHGTLRCVRLHGFPSDHVIHVDEKTLHRQFRKVS